ncbi:MAG: radical SAM protein [Patescibacteria group bacterium]
MYKKLSAPLVVQVELTEGCPNNCLHCYNFWRKEKKIKAKYLSQKHTEEIIEKLAQRKIFHIIFTGGEPLLNKKSLFSGIEKCNNAGISVGINSSLIPISNIDAQKMKEMGISLVLTSLMGPNAEIHDAIAQREGSFHETVRGIKILQNVGVPVDANIVISKKNFSYLREIVHLAKELGFRHVNSTRAGCPGNCLDFSDLSLTTEEFRKYLDTLYVSGQEEGIPTSVLESYPLCGIKDADVYHAFTGRRCLAGITSMTISPEGFVRPCSHFDQSYGNLITEDLTTIWDRMEEWRNGSLIPETCRSCKALAFCGGGCRMEAKMINGSINAIDPYAVPEDAEYALSRLLSMEKNNTPMPNSFRVNPKVKMRKEDFGGIVFTGTRLSCYLNKDSFGWLEKLDRKKIYSIDDFSTMPNTFFTFLQKLYNKNALI